MAKIILFYVQNFATTPFRQFILFLGNGMALGLVSWASQLWIFHMLGESRGIDYAISTALVYPPLIIANYAIQRHAIFLKKGCFKKFVVANLSVMALVTLLSPAFRSLLALAMGSIWGDRLGFAVAAIVCSPLSFMIKRHWVFNAYDRKE